MKKFIFCFLCLMSINMFAASKTYPNKLNHCKITRNIFNDYEPKVFETTNNLLRKTGRLSKFYGERILIKGKVLDQNCVPVADAKVYLWQAGSGGKYPYEPLKTRVDKRRFTSESDSSFTGSGTATTNNKGEYYFISMLPYKSSRYLRSANIRVEHPSLTTLETRLDLSNKNMCDNECGEVNPILIEPQENIVSYCFDLVLHGTTLKRY
ncbi:MAG: dioxygenase [Rickettsia endosymbiont of Ixodes persulcatus]|nr:dioxygenase [Rickettsia endosymbiont of Ixodes persulcatus]MCZ6902509.1 dioxygenase [Rickettsia endosymbiont of Ixodes persulcatus]MCZ6903686.1 dioxygenase [Rickettsia endosymbiont of Ixodes persulcatus]MCZ6909455.1 dioxygenase [Rickettsia endosymbiont of Ixodes persulcatus]MCZ6909904.1 dioxygenase [Rickettsia endosymbiont of Ixodes persulcatus]